MSFRNRPPSSMPQRRSMKGKIGGYLKRTTMASLATLAEQFGNMRPYIRASARSSTSREATFPIPKESSTTNDISSLSCTTITPIDEGFHQTQQKVVSMDSWILNDTTKTNLLSRMPIEILRSIIQCCDYKTVLTLSLVSWRWYHLSVDNAIWRQLYLGHPEWIPQQQITTSSSSPWKRHDPSVDYRYAYNQRFQLERRWATGDKRMLTILGHADSIYCVQFDAQKIVTGSRDHTIKCWDMQGRCVRTLVGHTASVLCLQYDTHCMVSGSSDHSVLVWDMHTFRPIQRLLGHTSGVLDVALDDSIIASCSKDTTIRLWSRQDGRHLRTLLGHRGPVNAIQFRESRLVSASGDAVIKLWDMNTGQCLRDFVGHTRGLACIRFDGKRIVSGSNDFKIKVWDAETGLCLQTLTGHTGLVRALHFDQDRVVSGSYDQSIRVWDINTGALLHHFEDCHSSWVFDVTFDKTKIISTSQDQKILIMDFAYNLDTRHII
ncbi:wd40 repeat-like protein [Lichtheimia corymbifera JMRC:FSU:9682]|uniref:Wd40 repeat-like protein n=1 Tax=Lichtheimia corymbifera JMRC:FSU:9682 TaxID=1263082 RepID=A0A068RSD1_9FUNG|nr:wd40 repeat-like protein [Lichtheimia corymbifera JMRC:FSU:9682]